MIDIDLLKTKTLACALAAGLVLGGCANMGGSGTAEEAAPQAGDEQGVFAQLDRNMDDRVSEDEFQRYANQAGLFRTWDRDGDGNLQEQEFEGIGLDGDVEYRSSDQDGDGEIGSDELFGSLFDAYDEDSDGYWDTSEWDDVGDSGLFDV